MAQERTNKTIEKRENYEAFVEKFKPSCDLLSN